MQLPSGWPSGSVSRKVEVRGTQKEGFLVVGRPSSSRPPLYPPLIQYLWLEPSSPSLADTTRTLSHLKELVKDWCLLLAINVRGRSNSALRLCVQSCHIVVSLWTTVMQASADRKKHTLKGYKLCCRSEWFSGKPANEKRDIVTSIICQVCEWVDIMQVILKIQLPTLSPLNSVFKKQLKRLSSMLIYQFHLKKHLLIFRKHCPAVGVLCAKTLIQLFLIMKAYSLHHYVPH